MTCFGRLGVLVLWTSVLTLGACRLWRDDTIMEGVVRGCGYRGEIPCWQLCNQDYYDQKGPECNSDKPKWRKVSYHSRRNNSSSYATVLYKCISRTVGDFMKPMGSLPLWVGQKVGSGKCFNCLYSLCHQHAEPRKSNDLNLLLKEPTSYNHRRDRMLVAMEISLKCNIRCGHAWLSWCYCVLFVAAVILVSDTT